LVNGFYSDGKQNLVVRGDNGSLAGNVPSMTEVDDLWEWVTFGNKYLGKLGSQR